MSAIKRIQRYLVQSFHGVSGKSHPKYFTIGPLKYDVELAWKLINSKQIHAPIEKLPIAPYLRYVGFDPTHGPSHGFKMHIDRDDYENMTKEEALAHPGIVVHSAKLGPLLISGNAAMAKLFELGYKTMKVYVISSQDEPQIEHKR